MPEKTMLLRLDTKTTAVIFLLTPRPKEPTEHRPTDAERHQQTVRAVSLLFALKLTRQDASLLPARAPVRSPQNHVQRNAACHRTIGAGVAHQER